MREIEFRGRDTDGIWHYGSLIKSSPATDYKGYKWEYGIHKPSIYDNTHHLNWNLAVEYVQTDTVGQFTGLYDKNGKKIYEGDIYRYIDPAGYESINECSWCYGGNFQGFDFSSFRIDNNKLSEIEVIGNIHDNPELIS